MTETDNKPRLLVLVGPTAVGKTELSLKLAVDFDCEIISGDSMQVYRGMDIGTAKATLEERAIVPHHMIDIHDPDHPFSVAEFQERTRALVEEIGGRGKLPFIVGGTGLYIESVCYGYEFSEGGSDEPYRRELNDYADKRGEEALHDLLKEADPESAGRIHPNDRRRTIRALEVLRLTGIPLSEHLARQKKESPYELCIVGLTMDREILYKRIEQRIDLMIEQGLVREVESLLARGYTTDLVSMQGLGYKEIAGYVTGETDLAFAVDLLKRNTRRFAKRQLSWFRHMKDIRWVDVTEANFYENLQTIRDIIAGKFPSDPEYTW
ncbi:tRNA (adenosine(37)-N6)-dimethylallyltransferase MiaA [Paenibacillus flagellatus]|uniref:tRNA dimethylallyltransferase n=1 Tax=Paenibacillus flagellatus TaxID=2211139 RepID=A0A2V5KCN8_9BACL|nr:tRNA (adenosine(37)-N6)-dimethylallyltransferase MiaA [Paenibacillus flagellatus]PYI55934.1 tRNA (adenosine(37)-N6)-dimethylallyltransferase MiaA [Paenibacillus flagellatus]